jgi:hypothetical protein
MANLVRPAVRSGLRVFSAILAKLKRPPSGGIQGVIVHDPDADKPKDLDNPFYTAESQERIGDLIARSIADKKPK